MSRPKLNLPTPVEEIFFDGDTYLIKRDELIHPDFSGNKARKFSHLFAQTLTRPLVSYGSNQSNAMYSLSALAHIKQVPFIYFVSHIPSYLREHPQGNYRYALEHEMQVHVSDNPESDAKIYAKAHNGIYIPEGGAYKDARVGIKALAHELDTVKNVDIFLPSGTGTTALFLQKYSSHSVYTTPCVGDEIYLKKQFLALEPDETKHPTILNTEKKYHFGKLYKEFYEIWIQLRKSANMEFDLLYDPKGWVSLLANKEQFKNPVLYVHQGGLIGNESMLMRYKRKFGET